MGDTHEIMQGEGGEQGDPFMPLLFSLGQHNALMAINATIERRRVPVNVLCSPEGSARFTGSFSTSCGIGRTSECTTGRPKIGTRPERKPTGCEELTAAARLIKKDARVWTGDQGIPTVEQGMRVLGSPIGHPDQSFLRRKTAEHSISWNGSPSSPMYNQHGSCCCSAQLPEEISGFVLCRWRPSMNLRRPTT